ncbi:MAG: type II toxin-antitoxin system death-on-curing family toxin, partial [Cyanobacteria bacterium P01_H01_bin.15]
MIRFLTLIEVLELHRKIIEQSGGTSGIRDMGLLESAIAQPRSQNLGQLRGLG